MTTIAITSILRKKNTGIASLILFFLTTNLVGATTEQIAQKEQPNVYNELAKLHLPSLANQELQEKQIAEQIQKENDKALEEARKINPQAQTTKNIKIQKLGDVEKLRITYQILTTENALLDTKTPVLHQNVANDLELFCGDKGALEHHLFALLDNTQTTAGKIELQKILYKPTTNITDLQKRQQIIKALIEDEALFKLLDEKLATIKNVETDFIWLWKTLDTAVQNYFNQAYFSTKIFGFDFARYNQSPKALEASTLWATIGQPTYSISTVAATMLFYCYLTYRALCLTNPNNAGKFKIPTDKSFLEGAQEKPGMAALAAAVWTGSALFIGLIAKLSIDQARMFNQTTNDIQTRMINCASFTNNIRDVVQAVELNQTLSQQTNFSQLLAYDATIDSDQTNALIDTLQQDTFKGQASFFSHKGRALAAFKTINEVKDNFISSVKAMGQIDAYMSIAKLYKKQAKNNNATYCFVDYAQNNTPYINITNGWHPALNPETVVTNNIELGQAGKAGNIIITGPNAGGKSTVLKTATIAIILAQTFGIAPAKSMTLTPFSLINTYLNIADTEGKESLFQAEMNRVQKLINAIKELKQNEFSFIIMDEIFTGTNPKEGMAAAYGVAKKLASFKNSMSIVATHFILLTDLDKDTNGAYENYKVCVNKLADGKIQFLYKLEHGITDQTIALELLQNAGFDSDIMQDAFNAMNKKQK
ncbi:MAG: hypothetical protein ABH827_01530 [bacterium]